MSHLAIGLLAAVCVIGGGFAHKAGTLSRADPAASYALMLLATCIVVGAVAFAMYGLP